MSWAFTHRLDVRYGECDQQGVVFNAHYLAFVDDTMDHWMRTFAATEWVETWDVMLKAARLVWHSPARWPEQLAVDCGVARWGTTSFDVAYALRVEDRAVADALVTYVSIDVERQLPAPPPPAVVAAMGPLATVPAALS